MASYSFFTLMNYNDAARYIIYWISAFCVFSAIPLVYIKTPNIKLLYELVVAITLLFNIHGAYTKMPHHSMVFDKVASDVGQNNKIRLVQMSTG